MKINIFKKIEKYEQVHPYYEKQLFKERTTNGKQIYFLHHPKAPDEPLAFIHVAFLPSIAQSIIVNFIFTNISVLLNKYS